MTGGLASELDGRTFVSTAVEGYELVEGTQVELTFDGDRLGFSAGCNSGGGTWSVDGDVLVVPAGMAMTEMACEPSALMDQETWAAALLTSRPTVALDGDTMTLTAAGGEVVTFTDREVADPDRPLEGTTWNVESFIEADAVSSIALARTPNMVFEGGTVALDTGCNRGSGSYELTDTDLTFGPVATTRAACADQAGTDAERAVLATLTGTSTYEIDADVLTLRTGEIGLILRAADSAGGLEGLEGVTWTLDSIVDANTTTAAPELDRPATLSFDGGTVSIETGCNGGSGAYEVAGDSVMFGPIITTLIACPDPAGAIEQSVLAVLADTVTFAVADGTLTLTKGDQGLIYVAG